MPLLHRRHIGEHEFHIQRVTGVTMEPWRSQYDAEADKFTLIAGSGGAVRLPDDSPPFWVSTQPFYVVSARCWGQLWFYNRLYVEFGLVLFASRQVRRPVKLLPLDQVIFDRLSRARSCYACGIALDNEDILGLRCDNLSNVGAHCALSPLGKGLDL